MKRAYYYFCSCVDWDREDVHNPGGLCDMISGSRQVTRETYKRRTDRSDREAIECALGYETHPARGLIMADDFCVSYFTSEHHGEPVVGFVHSAIEHVFKGEIQ